MVLGGAGSALGVSFVALFLAGMTLTWRDGWKAVLVRVAGAWISADGYHDHCLALAQVKT